MSSLLELCLRQYADAARKRSSQGGGFWVARTETWVALAKEMEAKAELRSGGFMMPHRLQIHTPYGDREVVHVPEPGVGVAWVEPEWEWE